MASKKLLLLVLGAVLLSIILGCTQVSFDRTIDDPVVDVERLKSELEEVKHLNSTIGSDDFDVADYPAFLGVDPRNGKTLVKKFICWDGCPELGLVYLVYQEVATEVDCIRAKGTPIMSEFPLEPEYQGCEPRDDWQYLPREGTG